MDLGPRRDRGTQRRRWRCDAEDGRAEARSEVNFRRYELGYCGCGHKVFGDINGPADRMPVLFFDLIPPYLSADDAEQAFLARVEDARSGIPGSGDVADRRLRLGRQAGRKQIGRDDLRSPRSLRIHDDDVLADPRGILTQRQTAQPHPDRKLPLVHGEERQVHVVEVAILENSGRELLAADLHSGVSPETETRHMSGRNDNPVAQVDALAGPGLLRSPVDVDGID